MRRRDFIALLGAASAWPVDALAQQPGRVFRIGTLDNTTATARKHLWDAFKERMRALGYVEGRNILYEQRWANELADRHPVLAAELVALNVDVIVAGSSFAVRAAAAATRTIPIVTGSSAASLAGEESLANPSGNVTGPAVTTRQLLGLRFQLLKDAFPGLSRVGVLGDQNSVASARQFAEMEGHAIKLDLSSVPIALRGSDEIEAAFERFAAQGVGAVVLLGSTLLFSHRDRIAALALKYRLPTTASQRELVEAGCLMSYGASLADNFRRAADYVDKILKGARPADLPVEEPTTFKLVVSARTTKALSLDYPPPFLARVDEWIE